jgi:CO/xanthine dehydrogenase Mo-binding subunit
VQVVWSREDDMTNDFYRPMAVHRLEGGLERTKAGGLEVRGWYHHVVCQSLIADAAGAEFVQALVPHAMPRAIRRLLTRTAASTFRRDVIPDMTSTEGADDLPYRIGPLRVELSTTNPGVPVGFWRSVGHSHTAFAVESFIDELADAARVDPLDLRRKLLPSDDKHRRVLDLAAAAAAWNRPLPAGVGRGVAVHKSFGSWCAMVIEVSVGDDKRVKVHRVVAAIDCGMAINPAIVRSQVESGVIYGLSAALKQQITFDRGKVVETNFHAFPLLRMHEVPEIDVQIVDSDDPPQGVGEPGVPPVAPALCNAIFAATGKRIRRLPIERALAEGW